MTENLLPLGTVVKIRNMDKLMMISGYATMSLANPDILYDYSGFFYPEGYVNKDKIYQFNNEQIDGVVAMGYQDAETIAYMRAVKQRLQELQEEKGKK